MNIHNKTETVIDAENKWTAARGEEIWERRKRGVVSTNWEFKVNIADLFS